MRLVPSTLSHPDSDDALRGFNQKAAADSNEKITRLAISPTAGNLFRVQDCHASYTRFDIRFDELT